MTNSQDSFNAGRINTTQDHLSRLTILPRENNEVTMFSPTSSNNLPPNIGSLPPAAQAEELKKIFSVKAPPTAPAPVKDASFKNFEDLPVYLQAEELKKVFSSSRTSG
ncbi:hypothetical protein Slin15195_G086600 [Septoria linicola]|uniref:Uncharacterized protein n=1 Tax=Septoria linicola TaxID=215465 RepID=A0A9Q9B122_9PEZI|nr:hypothetical protein Slin14017_G089190 [Septoria linicola]USW55341.1 hypothetical protein Slin15195_G086600 [Septoria linicola]